MNGRFQKAIVSLTIAITLVVCVLVVTDWIPAIRGPVWLVGEWRWPHVLEFSSRWWLPLSAAFLTLSVSVFWLRSKQQNRMVTTVALLSLMACSVLLQWAIIYADRPAVAAELVDRTLAIQTSGYYRAAAGVEDIGEVLREFPSYIPGFESEHLRTKPPGLLVINWLTIQLIGQMPGITEPLSTTVGPLRCTDIWLFDQPAGSRAALLVLSLLPVILAALSIPLAYGLSRELMPAVEARIPAIFVAIIPAFLLFTPLADQIFVFLTLAVLWLFVKAIRRRSSGLFFISGIVLSFASMLSLGNLALGLLNLLTMAFLLYSEKNHYSAYFRWGLAFTVGAISLWIGYWLLLGVTPWAIANGALKQHYDLVTSIRRYDIWLAYNPVDLILFAGPPVMLGFLGVLFGSVRSTGRKDLDIAQALNLSLALLIIILLLSGSTRGEVGRIWLFVMPVMAIAAGKYWADTAAAFRVKILLISLQLSMVLCLGLAWRPVEAVIVVAEKPAMDTTNRSYEPAAIEFSDSLSLTGYQLNANTLYPGQNLDLTLRWRAARPASYPYTVFAHVVNDRGEIAAQYDRWPVHGVWPPTCWRPDETIIDPLSIALPNKLAPGTYKLMVGLYNADSGIRLPVIDGSDAVNLAEISVRPR